MKITLVSGMLNKADSSISQDVSTPGASVGTNSQNTAYHNVELSVDAKSVSYCFLSYNRL